MVNSPRCKNLHPGSRLKCERDYGHDGSHAAYDSKHEKMVTWPLRGTGRPIRPRRNHGKGER